MEEIATVTKLGATYELAKATQSHMENGLTWITWATAVTSSPLTVVHGTHG